MHGWIFYKGFELREVQVLGESRWFFNEFWYPSHLFSKNGRFCSVALDSPNAHGFVRESLDAYSDTGHNSKNKCSPIRWRAWRWEILLLLSIGVYRTDMGFFNIQVIYDSFFQISIVFYQVELHLLCKSVSVSRKRGNCNWYRTKLPQNHGWRFKQALVSGS